MILRPLPGDGLLARRGDLVLLCAADARYDEEIARLLGVLADTAAAGGDGRRLGRQLAGLLGAAGLDDVDEYPPLCALGPAGSGLAVLVHGAAVVEAVAAGGPARLDGSEAVTWVDRVLTGPVESVRAVLAGAAAAAGGSPPSRWAQLESGIVAAGGLVFAAEGARAAPGPAPTAAIPAPPAARPAPPASAQTPPPAAPARPAAPAARPISPAASQPPPAAGQTPAAAASAQASPAAPPPAPPTPVPPPTPAAPPAPAPSAPASPPPPPPAAPPVPEPPAFSIPSAQPSLPGPEPTGVTPPVPGARGGPRGGEPPARTLVDRAAPFEAVLLVGAAPATAPAPLPLAGVPAPAAEAPGAGGPMVPGIYCTNDHFNDPQIPYCAVCGISMVQATHVARLGPRPPLGVLVLDDGATFRLDTPYVVGREPERDNEVAQGRARALRIMDRGGVVSRVHARIELEGWEVRIVDLGSANGTRVNPHGSGSWTRVTPGSPQSIKPGTRVVFGNRGLRYESHRNP